MTNNRTLTFGLLWHSVNSANLGVGALTLGNLALLRRAALQAGIDVSFVILGFVDQGRRSYVTGDDIEAVRLDTRAMLPGGLYERTLRRLDAVIDIGGGDSFADIYGTKRFAFLWWSKVLAIRMGKPLILAPQTIGPFTRTVQKRLAAWTLARAEDVFARDPLSYDFALKMSPHAKVTQSVDVAFALPFERPVLQDEQPTIGINVSGLLYNRGYDRKNSFGMEIDYRTYVDGLLAHLHRQAATRTVLVPHVLNDAPGVDDDRRVSNELLARFPGLERAPDFADPIAAKSFISGLSFLTGGRMHACIAAYSSGVPVLPVAYSRKFSGLFHDLLDYPHIIPAQGISTGKALAVTLDAIANRERLRADIAPGAARIDGWLEVYVERMAQLITRLARSA